MVHHQFLPLAGDQALALAGRKQRGLVGEVGQVSAAHARRRGQGHTGLQPLCERWRAAHAGVVGVARVGADGGQGAGVAANGVASLNKLSETTRASISREALVTADAVNVNAQLSLGVIAVTGAVTKSENSGVGIGLAMNEVADNTRAYVGDNDTDGGDANTAEGTAGAIETGALRVQAESGEEGEADDA